MPAAARPSGPEDEYSPGAPPGEGRDRAGALTRHGRLRAPTTSAMKPPFGLYRQAGGNSRSDSRLHQLPELYEGREGLRSPRHPRLPRSLPARG